MGLKAYDKKVQNYCHHHDKEFTRTTNISTIATIATDIIVTLLKPSSPVHVSSNSVPWLGLHAYS